MHACMYAGVRSNKHSYLITSACTRNSGVKRCRMIRHPHVRSVTVQLPRMSATRATITLTSHNFTAWLHQTLRGWLVQFTPPLKYNIGNPNWLFLGRELTSSQLFLQFLYVLLHATPLLPCKRATPFVILAALQQVFSSWQCLLPNGAMNICLLNLILTSLGVAGFGA